MHIIFEKNWKKVVHMKINLDDFTFRTDYVVFQVTRIVFLAVFLLARFHIERLALLRT